MRMSTSPSPGSGVGLSVNSKLPRLGAPSGRLFSKIWRLTFPTIATLPQVEAAEIVHFERACRAARIVRRRSPGPNVKNERRHHHGETHGGAGQDRGEAEPWRADAEISGEFLTVWGVGGKPLGKQCVGEREQQIESAQSRGNRYHARGNEGGKCRVAGDESNRNHPQHEPAETAPPPREWGCFLVRRAMPLRQQQVKQQGAGDESKQHIGGNGHGRRRGKCLVDGERQHQHAQRPRPPGEMASERAVRSSTAIRRRRGASGANTPSATARPNAAITIPATNPYEISIMRTSVASSSVIVRSGVANARQRKTPNEESALENLSGVAAARVNRRCHQNQSIAIAIASTVKTSNANPTRGQPRLSWTAVDQFCK